MVSFAVYIFLFTVRIINLIKKANCPCSILLNNWILAFGIYFVLFCFHFFGTILYGSGFSGKQYYMAPHSTVLGVGPTRNAVKLVGLGLHGIAAHSQTVLWWVWSPFLSIFPFFRKWMEIMGKKILRIILFKAIGRFAKIIFWICGDLIIFFSTEIAYGWILLLNLLF